MIASREYPIHVFRFSSRPRLSRLIPCCCRAAAAAWHGAASARRASPVPRAGAGTVGSAWPCRPAAPAPQPWRRPLQAAAGPSCCRLERRPPRRGLAGLPGLVPGPGASGGVAAGLRGGPRAGRATGRRGGALLRARLTPWRVSNPDGSREGLITGYYEPLITGSRQPGGAYNWPVLGCRTTCSTIDLGVIPELKGLRVRGRLVGKRCCPIIPAPTSARGSLRRQGPCCTPRDAVELFFLQVQGSGACSCPTAASCASPTPTPTAIPTSRSAAGWPTRASCASSRRRWRASRTGRGPTPGRLQEMLNANPSYIFFRECPAPTAGRWALGQPSPTGAAWR